MEAKRFFQACIDKSMYKVIATVLPVFTLLTLVVAVASFSLGVAGSLMSPGECSVARDAASSGPACLFNRRPAFWYSLAQIAFIGVIAMGVAHRCIISQ